jgi:hypothetical protein
MVAAAVVDGGFQQSNGAKQLQLGQDGNSVVQADFLDDLAILEREDGHAREVHLSACVGGQAAGQEIREGWAGMHAAALPLADDKVSFRD